MDDPYQLWRCKFCRELYVVPNLARDCEQRHRDEGWPESP